ncbi:IucA/IucC family protein [Streptomyces sp. NPDC012756]|uniref:IucA/IucC family protein n=1 Tax=Streptomyces sp. NPDC012756 TaxID=3364847 RepID=UPI0036C5BC16
MDNDGDVEPVSEAALRAGTRHGPPCHPAPKARTGGGPPAAWLRSAPEAYARFPLVLLGVRADAVVGDGGTRALDCLGQGAPGYRLLPSHPWQFALTHHLPSARTPFLRGAAHPARHPSGGPGPRPRCARSTSRGALSVPDRAARS